MNKEDRELKKWLKKNPIYFSCVCDKCKGTGIIETLAPFPIDLKNKRINKNENKKRQDG